MSTQSKKPAFGWLIPTGKPRMPPHNAGYTKHIDQIITQLAGKFHSLWIPDHFMAGEHDLPEALVSLSYFASLYPDFHLGTAVLGQNYRNPALLAKMAVVPFQVWMPWVHAEHPTCIAGLLAVYANIAAYVMVRVLVYPLYTDFRVFSMPLMIMALITMVYGSLLTMAQTDVKRFAACSTISQLAYSLLGISALTIFSVEGGMFFFLGHIIGKTILFSTAGILVYSTGIRDMRQMGGLGPKMPVTATLWIMGAMALSGFPPMSSFPAEWIMFTGIFKSGIQTIPAGLVVAILGAAAIILTAAYTFRSVKIIFFGPLNPALANDEIKDPPFSMSVPLLLAGSVSIILGIYPKLVIKLFHLVVGGLPIP